MEYLSTIVIAQNAGGADVETRPQWWARRAGEDCCGELVLIDKVVGWTGSWVRYCERNNSAAAEIFVLLDVTALDACEENFTRRGGRVAFIPAVNGDSTYMLFTVPNFTQCGFSFSQGGGGNRHNYFNY